MERHENVVLQEWVGTRTVVAKRRGEPVERRRRADHQGEEEAGDQEQREQRPRQHRVVALRPELQHHRNDIPAEHECPKQNRALERRPEGGDVEQGRRLARTVLGNERHREISGDKGSLHHHDRRRGCEHHHPRQQSGLTKPTGASSSEAHHNDDDGTRSSGEAQRHGGRAERGVAHAEHASAANLVAASLSANRWSYSSSLM
jgi:hypothetical protein